MILIYILIAFVALIILLWQLSNFISIFAGSLYVKTNIDLIKFALNKAGLSPGDVFYDLGCGNGDVVIEAAKMGARATGYEISPFYFLMSKLKTLKMKNATAKYQNIKTVDLKSADIVYCYLLPNFLDTLKNKILKENPKKVISIGFKIKDLPNERVLSFKNHKIFIYSLRSRSA